MSRKMNSKPVVRYTTTPLMGTTLRYKETLLTTIKGPLAKIFIEAHIRGERLIWSYDFENKKIGIYRSELLVGPEEKEPQITAESNP